MIWDLDNLGTSQRFIEIVIFVSCGYYHEALSSYFKLRGIPSTKVPAKPTVNRRKGACWGSLPQINHARVITSVQRVARLDLSICNYIAIQAMKCLSPFKMQLETRAATYQTDVANAPSIPR